MNGTGGALPNQNNSACSSSLPQRHPAGLRACWVVSFSASGTPSAHTPLPPSPALSASPPFPRPSFTHPPQGDPLSSLLLVPPPPSRLPDATANPPFSPFRPSRRGKSQSSPLPSSLSSSPSFPWLFPKECPLSHCPLPLSPRPSPTHPPQGDPPSPLLLIPSPPSQLPDATANLPSFSLSITLGNLLFASSVSPSFSPPPHKAQAFLLRPPRRRSPSSSRLSLTPFLVPSFSCVSSLRSFTHPPQGGSSFWI